MSREILVVKRDVLFGDKEFQGFLPFVEGDFISLILDNFEYRERDDVEKDSSLQQPIPYVWIVNPFSKKVFAYRRASGKSYNEQRLKDKWSGGVGGHIDRDTEHASENPVLDAMMRELREEVLMDEYPTPKIVGYLNDDSNDVGKVHFGIVAIAETTEDVRKGDDEMVHGNFYSVGELEKIFSDSENNVETWTQLSWPFVRDYVNSLD